MQIKRSILAARLGLSPCITKKQLITHIQSLNGQKFTETIRKKFCPEEQILGRAPKSESCKDFDCETCWAENVTDWKTERLEILND